MSSPPPPPQPVAPGLYVADVVIIGAGVAGLFAASRLPADLDVVILDKGVPGRSGSSPWAQGGMAAAIGDDDSPEAHARDTMRAGDGLCDPVAVRVLAEEAPARVADLLALGADFDREPGGGDDAPLHLAREGGQSFARSIHRADATGAEMVRILRQATAPLVSRLPGIAVAFARQADPSAGVRGVCVLTDDGLVLVRAAAVLLATGGCGGLFAATTNQDHATGDGVALAHQAGAAVRDQEFVQFHPTGLAVSGNWRFLLTEALRGAGATLHDADGHRFMAQIHPDAELAPRHVVAKAILSQPGGAWLDATHLSADAFAHEFPTVVAGARAHGFDLATERVPVTPAAHYMVGGVRTDLDARTSLPGLYAAGEVASTGVHGANRMAGNSLTEAMVFGGRAAATIAADLAARADRPPTDEHVLDPPALDPPALDPPALDPPALRASLPDDLDLDHVREALRTTMWQGAGPVRDAASLTSTLARIDELADRLGAPCADVTHIELGLALVTARLIASAALVRTESRGGHWREDFPVSESAWADLHVERLRTGEHA